MSLKYVRAIASSVVWAAALALTLSCRQIVDFDEPSSEAERVALPKLPFTPEPAFAQKCEACAREHCSVEREACENDAVCRELQP